MVRALSLSLAVTLGLISVAKAYVLPADYIVGMFLEKRRSLRIRDISVQLTADVKGHDTPLDEHLYMKQPERLRLVQQNDRQHIYVQRGSESAEGGKDHLRPRAGAPRDLLPLLLLPRGRSRDDLQERALKSLEGAGVDVSIVSLSRSDGQPVYIIGARPWEQQRPQVWFDKTTYLPLRYVTYVDEGGSKKRIETRLLEYGSEIAGESFPRVIEQYVDDQLTRRAEVVKLQINKSLPETLFDIPDNSR